MRKLCLYLPPLLLSLLCAPPAAAQSFSGFLRGLSNTLSGDKPTPPPQNSGATATIGIRGMDDETVATGTARPEDLKLIDGWSATKIGAEVAAKKRGLSANQMASYGTTAPVAEAATQAEEPQQ